MDEVFIYFAFVLLFHESFIVTIYPQVLQFVYMSTYLFVSVNSCYLIRIFRVILYKPFMSFFLNFHMYKMNRRVVSFFWL